MSTVAQIGTERAPSRGMMPREHGASVQLALVLTSASLVGPLRWTSVAFAIAAVLAFVAHEPLLVLVGRRGERARRDDGDRARRALAGLGMASATLGTLAVAGFSSAARPWVLPPLLLGAGLGWAIMRGARERTLGMVLAVVLALASLAGPIVIELGGPARLAATHVAVWSAIGGLGTLAARGVLYRQKDGGRTLRAATLCAAITSLAAVLFAVLGAALWPLAALPTALAVVVVGLRPPGPRAMRTLGLALSAAGLVALLAMATLDAA